MAWPGAVTKYSRRSPKLTTISPFLNCGVKRTNSRPLPPTIPPPPQSQNNCAEAGPEPQLITATMAPATMLALRNKRAMIIDPKPPLALSSRSPSTPLTLDHANAYDLATPNSAPAPVKTACSAVPFWAGTLSPERICPAVEATKLEQDRGKPAGAGLARAAATLAGPSPRSNPRKRDQGLERPTLYDPVRFQPHVCSLRLLNCERTISPRVRRNESPYFRAPRQRPGFHCSSKRSTTSATVSPGPRRPCSQPEGHISSSRSPRSSPPRRPRRCNPREPRAPLRKWRREAAASNSRPQKVS